MRELNQARQDAVKRIDDLVTQLERVEEQLERRQDIGGGSVLSQKSIVPVTIQGREYRIRGDGDPASMQRAAELLDETMNKVRARSGTADSVDVAVLAALNLANALATGRPSGGATEGLGSAHRSPRTARGGGHGGLELGRLLSLAEEKRRASGGAPGAAPRHRPGDPRASRAETWLDIWARAASTGAVAGWSSTRRCPTSFLSRT